MPRRRKTEIKVNDNGSLEGLLQETYNETCLQINDAQKTINELTSNVIGVDTTIDDMSKVAKEKGNLLKIKDSAIRIKLEIAKLQSDIIKSRGNAEEAITTRSNGSATLDDFKTVREMFKAKQNNTEESEENDD